MVNTGSDNVYLESLVISNMQLSLATQAQLEIFRDAEWDGVVGLGWTLDTEKSDKG